MSQVQTTIRSIMLTPSIKFHIDKHFKKLNRVYKKITNCNVAIDSAKKGKVYTVSIHTSIPKKELNAHKHHSNLFIAIRDSFEALEQILKRTNKESSKKSVTKDIVFE